jgi:hypothetical protein
MTVSRIRQDQIHTQGSAIDDTLSPPNHDSNAVDLADSIDYMASQLADILGETNWTDAPDETVAALAARAKLEDTLAETELETLTDVTVPNGQNYKLLLAAELPTFKTKAIATTTKGLVTAQHDGTFGSAHSLAELAGDTALSPRNLLGVVDGATGDPILSGGRVIWGLLQNEAGAGDGTAFTDTTPERAQVSFVRANATHDDLEACPATDIEDKVVNLTYVRRKALSERTPQDWLRRTAHVDLPTGAASVTLDNAVDNQGATPVTQDTDIEWRISDTYEFRFETSDGGRTLFAVSPNAVGDQIQLNVDTLDVNVGAAGTIDFDNGLTADSGGQAINVGVTAGRIDSTALKLAATAGLAEVEGQGVTLDGTVGAGGPLTADATYLDADFSGDSDSHLIVDPNSATKRTLLIAARNSGAAVADLELEADGDVLFETAQQTTAIPLDDATAGAISALPGGPHASISAAIKHAIESGGLTSVNFDIYVAGTNYAQGVNIPGVTLDLTTYDEDMGTPGTPGTPDLFLFLNGRLIRGASGTGVGDWYAGDTPASGDVKVDFPKGIKAGDVLITVAFDAA